MNYLEIFNYIYLITAGVTAFFAFSAMRLGRSKGVNVFSLLMISITVWILGAALGMRSPTVEISSFFANIRMYAQILTPIFWVVFSFMYTDHDDTLFKKPTIIFMLISVVSIFMYATTENHGLFFGGIELIQENGYFIDGDWHRGTYFWIYVIHSYSMIALGINFLVRKAIEIGDSFRRAAASLILGAIFPILGNAIIIFTGAERMPIHYDVLGVALGAIFISYAIWQLNLFDVSPIAHRVLIDSHLDGMIVVDARKRVVDINPAALKIIEKTAFEALGSEVGDYFSSQIEKLLSFYQTQTVKVEWHKEIIDDEVEVYDLQITPIYKNDKQLGFLFTLRNITEQKSLELRLKELAITDSLTGIFNHRHFYELFEKEFGRALRKERPLSIVMFDIDHFKKINDSYGHLVGDQILRDLAERCKGILRQYDIIARYGGEEFVVILPETFVEEAEVLAERLRKTVEETTFDMQAEGITVTISLGVSSLEFDQLITSEDLIASADQALYESKENGRNCVTIGHFTNNNQLRLFKG